MFKLRQRSYCKLLHGSEEVIAVKLEKFTCSTAHCLNIH